MQRFLRTIKMQNLKYTLDYGYLLLALCTIFCGAMSYQYYEMQVFAQGWALILIILTANVPYFYCMHIKRNEKCLCLARLLGGMSFTLTFYLANTIFASAINTSFAFIGTFVITAIYAYLTKSSLLMLYYYLILVGNYFSINLTDFTNWYIFLLLITLPYCMQDFIKNGITLMFNIYSTIFAVALMIFFLLHRESYVYGMWVYVVVGYFVILYMLDTRIVEKGTPYYKRPIKMLSYFGICLMLTISSVSDRWGNRVVAGSDNMINWLFFVVMVIICLFYTERIITGKITLEEVVVCIFYYISFAVYIFYEFYTPKLDIMQNYATFMMICLCVATWIKLDKYQMILVKGIPIIIMVSYIALFFLRPTTKEIAIIMGIDIIACAILSILSIRKGERYE